MLLYEDNIKAGDVVRNSVTGEPYDVENVRYVIGRGWEVWTRTVDLYMGPTFYPDMDRMPSPDFDHEAYLED